MAEGEIVFRSFRHPFDASQGVPTYIMLSVNLLSAVGHVTSQDKPGRHHNV
jgi:hypothetical protein